MRSLTQLNAFGILRPSRRAVATWATMLLGGVGIVACGAADAASGSRTVNNAEELKAALRSAGKGDTILLAPNDYGPLVIRRFSKGGDVTIASLDPSNPATLGNVNIDGASDLVLRDLAITIENGTGVAVGASSRVRLENLKIHGQPVGDVIGSGNGASVKRSSDVSIVGSEFRNLAHGISIRDIQNLRIERNYFHKIRADGIHGGGPNGLKIRSNVFTDFYRVSGDHPDAVQLWTTHATEPSKNITVEGNLILRGEGLRAQGIFITDQSLGRFPYENVVIRGNVVAGSMYHGITLSSAKSPVIENNLVLGYDDAKSWICLDRSTDGVVAQNEATNYRLQLENQNLSRVKNKELSTAKVGDLKHVRRWYAARPELFRQLPAAGRALLE